MRTPTSAIQVYQSQLVFARTKTLATLDELLKTDPSGRILGWRPGPGRAHFAWQILHVGITEELFATERLMARPAAFADLVPRFKGGSTPDEEIPEADLIRNVLSETRQHLFSALSTFNDDDLGVIPEPLRDRGWNLERVLQVLAWHEAHHQGQAHAALNLYKATHG